MTKMKIWIFVIILLILASFSYSGEKEVLSSVNDSIVDETVLNETLENITVEVVEEINETIEDIVEELEEVNETVEEIIEDEIVEPEEALEAVVEEEREDVEIAAAIMTGVQANLTIWDETDESNYGFGGYTRYPKQSIVFFANYTNNSLPISSALCNVSFYDGVIINMSYDSINVVYSYNRTFNYAGNYSYNVSCYVSGSGYDTLNGSDYVNVSQAKAGFSSTSLGNPGTSTSLVWADFDNDDDFDLVYTGSTDEFFYRNDDGTLNRDENYSFTNIQDGSIGFGDLDNDGDLDLVVNGKQFAPLVPPFPIYNRLLVYTNDGTSLTNTNKIDGTRFGSSLLFDFDKNGILDLSLLGRINQSPSEVYYLKNYKNNLSNFSMMYSKTGLWNGALSRLNEKIVATGTDTAGNTGANTTLYSHDNFNLIEQQNLTRRYFSTSATADFDNDGDLDLVIGGSTNVGATDYVTDVYKWNGTEFINTQNLTGLRKANFAVGDVDNDGDVDLIMTGENGSTFTKIYLNNGTYFEDYGNYSIESGEYISIGLFDYDKDGDLDLGFSGASLAYVYDNNVSLLTANEEPSAPLAFNNSFTAGQLTVSWGNGSDDLTPSLGLYYNLRVGSTPEGNDILSGKYAVSSNPNQGYLGNMMQALNYTLNITIDKTYYWQVQVIDSGLRAGNWSLIQTYNPKGCSVPDGSWNVNASCTKANENLLINGSINVSFALNLVNVTLIMNNSDNVHGIYLYNGSLNITNSIIRSVNTNIFEFHINESTIFDMDNSYLNDSLGLFINTSNVNIENNTIQNNSYGVKLYGSNITIKDSVVNNNDVDVYNYGSENNLTNVSFSVKSVSAGSLYLNHYLELNITNSTGSYLSGVTVYGYNVSSTLIHSGVTDENGYAKLTLTEYKDNGTETSYNNYTINFVKTFYNQESYNLNLNTSSIMSVSLNSSTTPTYTGFDDTLTTNFSNVSDVTNISEAKIGKLQLGQIKFSESIDVSNLNLTNLITTSANSISVNSIAASGINKQANLTFFNLSYNFTPVILKDNIVCSSCSLLSYTDYNLTFNVTGFSVYNSTSNSKIVLSYTNGYNTRPIINESIKFYANYTNTSSKKSINETNVNCSVDFGAGSLNMTFNTTLLVYEYNRSFGSSAIYPYNVSCDGSVLSYEMLNLSSTIRVKLNETVLDLDTSQSLEGTYKWASLVMGKLDNDNYDDIILSGETTSSPSSAITYWYFNNGSLINLTYPGLNYNISRGSSSLNDYDKDGDLDVFITGYDSSQTQRFLVVEND